MTQIEVEDPDREDGSKILQAKTSFFQWFEMTGSNETEDEIADIIREQIWPNPLQLYYGEGVSHCFLSGSPVSPWHEPICAGQCCCSGITRHAKACECAAELPMKQPPQAPEQQLCSNMFVIAHVIQEQHRSPSLALVFPERCLSMAGAVEDIHLEKIS